MLMHLLPILSDIIVNILISILIIFTIGTPLGIMIGFCKRNNNTIIYNIANGITTGAFHLPYIIFAVSMVYISPNYILALVLATLPTFIKQITNSIIAIPVNNWEQGAIFGASNINIIKNIIIPNIKQNLSSIIMSSIFLLLNLSVLIQIADKL